MIEHPQAQQVGDVVSISTLLGTLAGLLPSVAALLTIVWTGLRIYETATVRKWLNKRKQK